MLFKGFAGAKRLLVELRRIANALEVIALYCARLDGRAWTPTLGRVASKRNWFNSGSGSEAAEILHTSDEEMLANQLRDAQDFSGMGWGDDAT